MSDESYRPKTYRKDGGDTMVVASGGKIEVESGGAIVFPNPSGGMDYYVENNYGLDANDGLSWATPYKTLAKAIAVSNVYIAAGSSGWAARNRIFYRADEELADLVAFPQKCDVIGVGSDGQHPCAGITGTHAPINVFQSCRFYNVRFRALTAAPIISLIATSGATEFIGCEFDAMGDATATTAILSTAHYALRVVDSVLHGRFSTSFISIAGVVNSRVEIVGNRMFGSADEGVEIASTVTTDDDSYIKDNFISCDKVTIHDESNYFFVINNRCVTKAASAFATSIVVNLAKSAGNIVTGATVSSFHPVNANSAT